MLTVRPLNPGVEVLLERKQPVSPPAQVLQRVEEIWRSEQRRLGGAVFDGPVFSVCKVRSDRITGWLAGYKWFLAQRREPALFGFLRVCPLAVTGLLLCNDGVVFGRRAGHLQQDADLWELVPSGGVIASAAVPDRSIDLARSLLTELAEEVGVTADACSVAPMPFAIVTDSQAHVSDVGVLLRINLSGAKIVDAFSSLQNREHVVLETVALSCLSAFINNCTPPLSAVSSALIAAAPICL